MNPSPTSRPPRWLQPNIPAQLKSPAGCQSHLHATLEALRTQPCPAHRGHLERGRPAPAPQQAFTATSGRGLGSNLRPPNPSSARVKWRKGGVGESNSQVPSLRTPTLLAHAATLRHPTRPHTTRRGSPETSDCGEAPKPAPTPQPGGTHRPAFSRSLIYWHCLAPPAPVTGKAALRLRKSSGARGGNQGRRARGLPIARMGAGAGSRCLAGGGAD